ncbi:hypothetical protein E2C01_053201 [Portunus trituberculatus]|uniref:Uncharacterized protein n=1 Tax=Portunus trituberculatus TaxID=210409 RepID=A0A5B7GNU5_PORTR|nr:hypothetical protein [Portunus trituberculatus]
MTATHSPPLTTTHPLDRNTLYSESNDVSYPDHNTPFPSPQHSFPSPQHTPLTATLFSPSLNRNTLPTPDCNTPFLWLKKTPLPLHLSFGLTLG